MVLRGGEYRMTLITLNFAPEMEEAILQGRKCCTSRSMRKGIVGDLFLVKGQLYRILHIHSCALYSARNAYYDAEGFSSPEEFQKFWEEYVGAFEKADPIFLHFFAYVTDICPDFNLGCNSCIPDCCPASEVCNHGV